jgi:hypothetical protein
VNTPGPLGPNLPMSLDHVTLGRNHISLGLGLTYLYEGISDVMLQKIVVPWQLQRIGSRVPHGYQNPGMPKFLI